MIGIFDSGIGGLTVVQALKSMLPEYDMIYFGDTARTPYGSKSAKSVMEYALQDTEFLISKGAKLIVVACNTASSIAMEALTEKFDIPVFEVITPAAEHAVLVSKKLRIGVIGTRATINSGIYEKKILKLNPDAKILSYPCPLLVSLVEEGWIKKPETFMIVKKYLHPLKVRQIDTLIMGCTHYPILKDTIQRKIGKQVKLIDSSITIAENVKNFLKSNPDFDLTMQKNSKICFYVSDITEQFKHTAKSILKTSICLEPVNL
ncbi:Glutamate racemase [Desulfonema limicola]|uniref:Glutamate racemase n=1 Tax=Desulfonema limicola TaxID=45656 RepID=A0A975BD55_9BACT|nr:glutamate racemase [Desulfonema limicola]QTA83181.1 Glutamate racemase [Desulfonema limicola]